MKHITSAVSLLFIQFIICATTARLPSNFQKCNRHEPDLNQCLKKAAQHGLTQLTRAYDDINIPNVNPIEIEKISVDAGTGTSFAVKQENKNCKIFGLRNATVYKFELNFDKKTLDLEGNFEELKIICDYTLDGRILVLPIKGEGVATTIFKNSNVSSLLNYEEIKRRNKTYLKFISSKLRIEPRLIVYNYDNLFNGDKVLGDNTNKVLNENWKETYEDIRDVLTETVNTIFLKLFNNFFRKVSLEEALD